MGRLVALCMRLCLFGMWSALYAYTAELCPTRLRATGTDTGLAASVGRLGSLMGRYIVGMLWPATGQGEASPWARHRPSSPHGWWRSTWRPRAARWKRCPAEPRGLPVQRRSSSASALAAASSCSSLNTRTPARLSAAAVTPSPGTRVPEKLPS